MGEVVRAERGLLGSAADSFPIIPPCAVSEYVAGRVAPPPVSSSAVAAGYNHCANGEEDGVGAFVVVCLLTPETTASLTT